MSTADQHLREALERLRRRITELERIEIEGKAKEERLLGVVQELEVHREELRTQNENLRQTQSELENSHRLYIDLFEHAPVGYLFLDRDGIIHQLNLRGAEMLGRARSSLLGKPLWFFLLQDYRDLLSRHLHQVFRFNRAALEVGLRRADGSTFYGALESILVPKGDGLSAYCRTVLLDVSERHAVEDALRESEERFRNLIEGSIQGIFIHQNWKPLFANQAYADILGYSSPQEILAGDSFEHHIAPHERPRLRAYLTARLSGEEAPVHYEYEALCKDGAVVTLDKIVRLIYWKGQTAIQDTVIDISARKRAEEQARQREAELAHVARLSTMGEMATTLAHELNQPLTAIVSYAEGAVRRFRRDNEQYPELVDVLDQTAKLAKRAARIISGMRDFVRKQDNRFEPVNVNEVIAEAIRLSKAEARKRGIAVNLDLMPNLPEVHGNLIQLEQVMLNLIRNAIEAMENTESNQKSLLVATFTNGDHEIQLAVKDTGTGLPEDIAPRILDPFVTTKPEGLGLGLPISRTIVEAHGGRLWSHCQTEEGTTFYIALPIP
jgi:two-component system sensor kinase FixL